MSTDETRMPCIGSGMRACLNSRTTSAIHVRCAVMPVCCFLIACIHVGRLARQIYPFMMRTGSAGTSVLITGGTPLFTLLDLCVMLVCRRKGAELWFIQLCVNQSNGGGHGWHGPRAHEIASASTANAIAYRTHTRMRQ